MSHRDVLLPLRHMLEYAHEAMGYARGRNRSDLDSDRLLMHAMVRCLEVIGEAANRASSQMQQQYADVPWPAIIGLRNRLIHGYDSVDLDILWQIVSVDLPTLADTLSRILPPQ